MEREILQNESYLGHLTPVLVKKLHLFRGQKVARAVKSLVDASVRACVCVCPEVQMLIAYSHRVFTQERAA